MVSAHSDIGHFDNIYKQLIALALEPFANALDTLDAQVCSVFCSLLRGMYGS